MHICPICTTAAISGAAASIPIITRVYRRVKAWLGVKGLKAEKA